MTEYSDDFLRSVLKRTKVVAVVGVSMNPVRPSYYVTRYLALKGKREPVLAHEIMVRP